MGERLESRRAKHALAAALTAALTAVVLSACGGHEHEVQTSTQVIHHPDGSTTTVTKQKDE